MNRNQHIPGDDPRLINIRKNMLLLFEQSHGWKFRVKGTPLVDVVAYVKKDTCMVGGKQYGEFHIDLCELTNEGAPLSN